MKKKKKEVPLWFFLLVTFCINGTPILCEYVVNVATPYNALISSSINDDGDTPFCLDDTDCEKGYRCLMHSTIRECVKIPECMDNSGRENGGKYGECVACIGDEECGWFSNYDYCWPDGACREYPPFKMYTFVTKRHDDERGEEVVIEKSNKATQGERVCLSVVPWIKEEAFSLDISHLELCASSLYNFGKHRKILKALDRSLSKKKGLDDERRAPDIHYPGIIHFDPNMPMNTGCNTDPSHVHTYTVFTIGKGEDAMKDHTPNREVQTRRFFRDPHHFHPSMEVSTITGGGDTVCFDAVAITAPDIPIYIQAEIRLKPSSSSPHIDANTTKDDTEALHSVYGLYNSLYDADYKPSKIDYEWSGTVASPKFVDVYHGGAKRGEERVYLDTRDSSGLFVNCPSGTKFDGVAGFCQRPTVTNSVFFWVLLASGVAFIVGAVFFAIHLTIHKANIQAIQ
jgi:hypothetical protein